MTDDGSAPSTPQWPAPRFYFEVKWDSVVMCFQEVSGLDVEAQPLTRLTRQGHGAKTGGMADGTGQSRRPDRATIGGGGHRLRHQAQPLHRKTRGGAACGEFGAATGHSPRDGGFLDRQKRRMIPCHLQNGHGHIGVKHRCDPVFDLPGHPARDSLSALSWRRRIIASDR